MKNLEKNEEKISNTQEAVNLITDIKDFFIKFTNIEHDTDKARTIQDIKANISMQGHTAWILVFSIFIASIGLNVSSTAVVIGAMLISPLMGPILGVGMSIGINDVDMLRKSLINLGVMVVLSLVTSSLFFSIPLFNEATPELLARTQPDVRDVLIALSGGLALIIAISRPSQQINTVAGVAIATALMPPLCTAGFGIGTGRLDYFLGAMFLFTINAIFIALATFVIAKSLKFPIVKYLDSKRKKTISRIVIGVASIVLGFSIYSFYSLFKENQFQKQAKNFIQELKDEGIGIIADEERNINYKQNTITFFVFGNAISEDKIKLWQQDINKKISLKTTKLIVRQKDDSDLYEKVEGLTALYNQNQSVILSKDVTIQERENAILKLEKRISELRANEIPFAQICDEVNISYSGVKKISYAIEMNSDFKYIDTLKVFNVQWQESITKQEKENEKVKLQKWLKTRLSLDTVVLNER